jgi:tetratricopeptide (TPR) repeat protein
MYMISRTSLFLAIVVACCSALGDETMYALEKEGTRLRLSGDFVSAKIIENELIDRYAQPAGHVFALNSIITQLTWDETQTRYDEELIKHATKTLEWCEPRIDHEEVGATANYYCGQANFVLSFHNALRGNYYQAGRRGSASIDYLETALSKDPSLIDAKMHLGVGYHVADNLPPFIKMFSQVLWFIPTGNSEKSLPYLLDVIADGDQYRNVARYIYSVLLLETPELRPEASIQLQQLVSLYPANSRFQLRLISLLISMDDYEGTLRTISDYLDKGTKPAEPDLSLTRIWKVRAYLGRGETELARSTFAEIDPVFHDARDQLPGWSVAWYILTDGQLHDLASRRGQALSAYKEILSIAQHTYVNITILDAARAGLSKPYQLHIGQ